MGQQQLLLIVLGVIIVGIAIAVGISMFKSNAQTSNRDALINDLNNLAAKAEQYYRKPTAMAGGGQSFTGFALTPIDTINGNGQYYITNQLQSTGATATTALNAISADDPPTSSVLTNTAGDSALILGGWGNELGNNGKNKVQVAVLVTPNDIKARVVN